MDLPNPTFDHTPLRLSFKRLSTSIPRLFWFERFWLKYSEIAQIVETTWHTPHLPRNNTKRLLMKFKILCCDLYSWGQRQIQPTKYGTASIQLGGTTPQPDRRKTKSKLIGTSVPQSIQYDLTGLVASDVNLSSLIDPFMKSEIKKVVFSLAQGKHVASMASPQIFSKHIGKSSKMISVKCYKTCTTIRWISGIS